jgi:hypothetical protein
MVRLRTPLPSRLRLRFEDILSWRREGVIAKRCAGLTRRVVLQ